MVTQRTVSRVAFFLATPLIFAFGFFPVVPPPWEAADPLGRWLRCLLNALEVHSDQVVALVHGLLEFGTAVV